MIWNGILFFLLVSRFFPLAMAEDPKDLAEPEVEVNVEYRVASRIHKVRQSPSVKASLRGIVYSGDVFEVGPIVGYKDCEAGWGTVSDGYICLISTKLISSSPVPLPLNLLVLPPKPTEDAEQMITPIMNEGEAFMPTLHGKRDAEHKGRLWKSIESYENGDQARWRLSVDRDYRFVDAHETEKGWVLERPNGSIAPITEVYLYPSSRFSGRSMIEVPLLESSRTGFVMAKEGVLLYLEPSIEADVLLDLEYRRSIDVKEVSGITATDDASQEITGKEDWWQVPMGELMGYVPRSAIRLWSSMEKPEPISDDELWIDADVATQMLAVMRGDSLVYLTLMSSAKKGHETPLGTYQIYDKSTAWDLGSLDGAKDAYFMERVPYVMHYYPRYAIHSVFWHDEFGIPASHGCLNLSVKDAKVVFDMVTPDLPDGWRYVKQSKKHVGTTLRVRKGSTLGKIKKIAP